jgi:N-acetylglutamate synthase-like GNAT family acetyltransferase
MAERPNLTPWLAALYVRPAYRRRGVGGQLITRLVNHAGNAGFDQVYLSAADQVALYARHGFAPIETDVGPHRLTIMRHGAMRSLNSKRY